MKPTTDAHGQPHAELSPRLVDRDIDLRAVAMTVVGIALVTALAAVTMWWLLSGLLAGAEAADPAPAPAAAAVPRELPAGPRLQASPRQHRDRMRAHEERILSSYGRSPDGGVRIPIERAMEVLAAGGGALAVDTSNTAAEGATAEPSAAPGAFGAGAGGDPHAGHAHAAAGTGDAAAREGGP